MKHDACNSETQTKPRVRHWSTLGLRLRAVLAVVIALLTLAAECSPPRGRQQNYFPSVITSPPPTEPPQDSLMLWLEGSDPTGATYLRQGAGPAVPAGRVTEWVDRRGAPTTVVAFRPNFEGTRVWVGVRTRDGGITNVPALRCGDVNDSSVRCSYMFSDLTAPSEINLDGTPYTILAVVRRSSSRGDNYFLVSSGRACRAFAGGTGCDSNSALHIGWSGERTARLGQYDNDSVLDPVSSFSRDGLTLTLFVGRSGPGIGKQVALLEPGFNVSQTVSDERPLLHSSAIFVGGTPWGEGRNVPDWRFVGDILAVLVYRKALNTGELFQAQDYLRNRYGPV